MHIKGEPASGDDFVCMGFMGSLLERRFKTSEKAAREINKRRKKSSREVGVRSHGLAIDVMADVQVACALVLVLVAFFV